MYFWDQKCTVLLLQRDPERHVCIKHGPERTICIKHGCHRLQYMYRLSIIGDTMPNTSPATLHFVHF